ANADRYDRDRAVDADLPARRSPELVEGLLGHEHDDDGARLHAELKAEGGRERVVTAGRAAVNPQRAFPVFAADAEPRLHHGWKHENANRVMGEFSRTADLVVKSIERVVDGRIDRSGGFRLTLRR